MIAFAIKTQKTQKSPKAEFECKVKIIYVLFFLLLLFLREATVWVEYRSYPLSAVFLIKES